jgi:hypothetical protein
MILLDFSVKQIQCLFYSKANPESLEIIRMARGIRRAKDSGIRPV